MKLRFTVFEQSLWLDVSGFAADGRDGGRGRVLAGVDKDTDSQSRSVLDNAHRAVGTGVLPVSTSQQDGAGNSRNIVPGLLGAGGVTTSIIFLIYTGASIVSAFVIAGGMFGAMAVFGSLTKRSLSGVGQFMFMGLIGLLAAMVVNIFLFNDVLSFVISVVGVVVFTGLTAWHAQRLKHMAVALPDGRVGAYAVVGALSFYLDFVNLFFFILRLMGGRRN